MRESRLYHEAAGVSSSERKGRARSVKVTEKKKRCAHECDGVTGKFLDVAGGNKLAELLLLAVSLEYAASRCSKRQCLCFERLIAQAQ